jgi:hypothetical protein
MGWLEGTPSKPITPPSPERLAAMKAQGFPPEDCHCIDDGLDVDGPNPNCEHCGGTGEFQQAIHMQWYPPLLQKGEHMEAFLDVDIWVLYVEGPSPYEVAWPFTTAYATAQHLQALGFWTH